MKQLLLLIFLIWSCSEHKNQSDCEVKIYLDLTNEKPIGSTLDPTKTQLDSLLIDSHEIVSVDTENFSLELSRDATSRLREMDLDWAIFTIVIDNNPIIAGRFWSCFSSIGGSGYVAFNFNCGSKEGDNQLRIRRTCANKS